MAKSTNGVVANNGREEFTGTRTRQAERDKPLQIGIKELTVPSHHRHVYLPYKLATPSTIRAIPRGSDVVI
jgi:hypothetical protein